MTTGGEGGQPPVPRRWREIRRSPPSPSPGFCLKSLCLLGARGWILARALSRRTKTNQIRNGLVETFLIKKGFTPGGNSRNYIIVSVGLPHHFSIALLQLPSLPPPPLSHPLSLPLTISKNALFSPSQPES